MRRDPALIPLSHQHHDILALCVVIDRGLKRDPSVEHAVRLRQQAEDHFRLLIEPHFEVEETVLFPLVREMMPDSELPDALQNEHQELRLAVEMCLKSHESELPSLLPALGAQLSRHVRKEERILFQTLQQTLDEAQMKSLGDELSNSIQKVCIASPQPLGNVIATR